MAGFIKSLSQGQLTHQDILARQIPWFYTIAISGLLFLIGMILIIKAILGVKIEKWRVNTLYFNSGSFF